MTNPSFELLRKLLETKGVTVDKNVDGLFLHVNGETFAIQNSEVKLCLKS